MSERLKMQGLLADLEQEVANLTLRIDGFATSIREGLNTALTPVEKLEIAKISLQMRDLEAAYVELQGKLSRVQRLKKELGRG